MSISNTTPIASALQSLFTQAAHALDLIGEVDMVQGQRACASFVTRAKAYKGPSAARIRRELPTVAADFGAASAALSEALKGLSEAVLEELGPEPEAAPLDNANPSKFT